MLRDFPSLINEEFYAGKTSPPQTDALLASGWRHFGEHFFRHNIGIYNYELRRVLPLRIRLSEFVVSRSQQRVLRKNRDLRTIIRPIEITAEKEILFKNHRRRFKDNVPDSLYDFLSASPAQVPCRASEVCLYEREKLLAASFFDVGEQSVSAVYAMFDAEEKRRSLGIYTMLLVIDYALKNEKVFYYPGYVYEGNSFYDYKKRFSGLEFYDWNGNWITFESDV